MLKKRLVVANWKGYIESTEEAVKFAVMLRRGSRMFAGVEAWLAPPFPLIPIVADALKSSAIKVGGQAVSPFNFTPFDSAHGKQSKQHTGEVSGAMLKNIGAQFCIVGHSERRAHGETNEEVRMELANALSSGLAAILCVGEKERDLSGSHFAFVAEQITSALAGLVKPKQLLVAYEPLWAIGKNAEDAITPQDLEEVIIFIRKTLAEALGRKTALRVPILYGGSVEPANVPRLISERGISGFLVGHASADAESFIEILKLCRK